MEVRAWEERIKIPTYKTGQPDKNPMFLEKRVYQGSSGVVYPYQVIDKVYDEKEEKVWTALYLENEYLKVMILPELGGRIQMAYDKTNDYHFVYHNNVIKPALVGLLGPWISGGIEFNWPQHHRPTTFDATDFAIVENRDGSKTVWVNEYEKMFNTKCALGFTLYKDKAYIELEAKIYNRTPFPQTFLWWANPAVAVDEHYQSVFPPDVHAVFDHGKRDVSSFPIATGTYYKVDYAPGTDISVYTNIPVPTSYMAVNSRFDFVGGYHHKKRAGLMHIANHHVSPGKKQWTWGCGEFGQAWDRQLTDEDGPYFELMCGVFTDNQPDFGWLMPNEVRGFRQYFMPYKNIGYVKNASVDAMINLEVKEQEVCVQVYVTQARNITVQLNISGEVVLNEHIFLSPAGSYEQTVMVNQSFEEKDIRAVVLDEEGNELIAYTPVTRQGEAIPDPAKPVPRPEKISSNEELFLAGLHLEQYRHATYSPLDYYEEALKRDASDIRCNNAMGLWYLRRAMFGLAEEYLRKAAKKIKMFNPNPYDGEPLFNLGLCLRYQQRYDEAEEYLYKSTWNAAMQDNAYLQLGYIAAIRNDWKAAAAHAEKSCLKNYHSLKSRHLRSLSLRKQNRLDEAVQMICETLAIDLFDFAGRFELVQCYKASGRHDEAEKELNRLTELMRDNKHTIIEMALQYSDAGCYDDASALLAVAQQEDPLLIYYRAYFLEKLSKTGEARLELEKAMAYPPVPVFPNRIEDVQILKFAADKKLADCKPFYYLGNFYYAKRLYQQAREMWETAIKINPGFPTAKRNLAIAWYNKFNRQEEALQLLEEAFFADTSDSRVLLELDQLKKKLNVAVESRLQFLKNYEALVGERDDLYIEYVILHSLLGEWERANSLLQQRNFHPWEGGEGKTSGQHILLQVELAKIQLKKGNLEEAEQKLQAAAVYPLNIGEGKLYGAQENDIYYWLGCVEEAKGNTVAAGKHWQQATVGLSEPAPAIYYNDQQPDKIFYQGLAFLKLGNEAAANERFNKLLQYGEQHLNDCVEIDFFAVSLPDLMIFDDDLNMRNKVHCYYLMGLGRMGKGEIEDARKAFQQVLTLDAAHIGATIHQRLLADVTKRRDDLNCVKFF